MNQRRTRSRFIAVAIAADTCTTAIARTGRPGITAAPRFITRHRVITRRLATIRRPAITRRLLVTTGQATVVDVQVTVAATGMVGVAATTGAAPAIVRRLKVQGPVGVAAAGMATTAAGEARPQADRVATCGRMVTSVAVVTVDRAAAIAEARHTNGALRSAVFL